MRGEPALQRRTVAVECLTRGDWLSGHFHVPFEQSFLDFLQHGGAFLPLTDVTVPGRLVALPFFAIQRDGLALIAPIQRRLALRPWARRASPHRGV